MYSGYVCPHSNRTTSWCMVDISTALRGVFCYLHASQGPHVCVENDSKNFLSTGIRLSDSLCTHVTLYALSIFPLWATLPFPDPGSYRWPNGGVQMETPFWVPRGDTFQKALPWGNGAGGWRPEPHPRRFKQEQPQAHGRSPELQRLRVCKQLRTTLLVAVLPCRNRLGNLLAIPMSQQSSGSIQKLKKCSVLGTLGRTGASENPCSKFYSSSTVWQSSQAFISAVPWRGDSYLLMRKTSRPYETGFQLGLSRIPRPSCIATLSMRRAQIQRFARLQWGSIPDPKRNTASTTMCPTVHLYRKGSALTTGTRTSTRKRRSHRKTHCREVACHHPARSKWISWQRVLDESFLCDTLRRVRDSVQQGHFSPGHKSYFCLSPWNQVCPAARRAGNVPATAA